MTRSDLSTEIVTAVAATDGVEPSELDSLYDYVEPVIVDKLGELDRGDWSFTFRFSDHQITVDQKSQIFVDGVRYRPSASLP